MCQYMRLAAIALALPFSRSIFHSPTAMRTSDVAQELLPANDRSIIASESLPGGQSNIVTKYTTLLGNQYVLKEPRVTLDRARFDKILSIAQMASALSISPYVYSFHRTHQAILMIYIPNIPWPLYEDSQEAYVATMRTLKSFHEGMRSEALKYNPTTFQPFTAIFHQEQSLVSNPLLPNHLKVAFTRMRDLYEQSLPWLKEHATVYHGDLKKKNILLEQRKDEIYPWLIDFDHAATGHPYFDVAKFSQKLLLQQRLFLFEAYLGHVPTKTEMNEFAIADNALRMLITIIRFNLAQKAQLSVPSAELLSKEEMEALLDSPEPLPSQATILVSDPDPKKQQLAALYSLDEFLRNSHTSHTRAG